MARRKKRHHRKHTGRSKSSLLKGSVKKLTAIAGVGVAALVGYTVGKKKA